MDCIKSMEDGVVLNVRVVPRASRNEIAGPHGDALKIRLQAPPVEGKANKALVRFLAGQLRVPSGSIRIVAGETGRDKRIGIAGISAEETRRRLNL